jgi:hypothetical protein
LRLVHPWTAARSRQLPLSKNRIRAIFVELPSGVGKLAGGPMKQKSPTLGGAAFGTERLRLVHPWTGARSRQLPLSKNRIRAIFVELPSGVGKLAGGPMKQKSPTLGGAFLFHGAPGEIRTPDPRLRRPMLYPAELRAQKLQIRSTATTVRRVVINSLEIGGERGIRTLDGLLTHTPLAGVRLRPLGHLSAVKFLRLVSVAPTVRVTPRFLRSALLGPTEIDSVAFNCSSLLLQT